MEYWGLYAHRQVIAYLHTWPGEGDLRFQFMTAVL